MNTIKNILAILFVVCCILMIPVLAIFGLIPNFVARKDENEISPLE